MLYDQSITGFQTFAMQPFYRFVEVHNRYLVEIVITFFFNNIGTIYNTYTEKCIGIILLLFGFWTKL